jgi:L,D-transpeptidase ErfK/SrfK
MQIGRSPVDPYAKSFASKQESPHHVGGIAIAFVNGVMRIIPFTMIAALACGLSVGAQDSRDQIARRVTGGVSTYTTMKDDTLQGIGARFGVDATTLAADNELKVNVPLPVGLLLWVDNRHLVPAAVTPGVIIVNVPQRMLFYEWETVVAGFPVAVGQPTWKTPRRAFTVMTRERNPAWDVPESIRAEARRAGRTLPAVVPPGPNNPLGKFWLGLSIPGVGIHGTNAPASIYRAATHGCVRVGPDDIAWLFARVTAGTLGEVIYQPILLGVVGGDIFLEVHRDIYRQQHGDAEAQVRALAELAGVAADIDWDAAEAALAARRGIATRVGAR